MAHISGEQDHEDGEYYRGNWNKAFQIKCELTCLTNSQQCHGEDLSKWDVQSVGRCYIELRTTPLLVTPGDGISVSNFESWHFLRILAY